MLISLLIILLLSNALTLRKDKSILFSRIVMVSLVHTSFLAYNNSFSLTLDKGIGIIPRLFLITVFTPVYNITIFVLSTIFNIGIFLLYYIFKHHNMVILMFKI